MAKEKKITIKYFVKIDAKPLRNNGKEIYPLYMQIIYDGRNTKIKVISGDLQPARISGIGDDYENNKPLYVEEGTSDAKFDLLKKNYINKYIHLNENVIRNIMKYEVTRTSKRYSFKGLGEKLLAYNLNVFSELERTVQFYFQNDYLQDKLSYREFRKILDKRNTRLRDSFYYVKKKDAEFYKELDTNTYDYFTVFWTLYLFINSLQLSLKAYHWIVFNYQEKYSDFLLALIQEGDYSSKIEKIDNSFLSDLSSMFHIDESKLKYYASLVGDSNIENWGRSFIYIIK